MFGSGSGAFSGSAKGRSNPVNMPKFRGGGGYGGGFGTSFASNPTPSPTELYGTYGPGAGGPAPTTKPSSSMPGLGSSLGAGAPSTGGPSNEDLIAMLMAGQQNISGSQNAEFLGLMGQYGLADGQYNLGANNLRSNTNLAMQALGIRQQGIGQDRALNDIQLQRLGLDRAGLGLDRAALGLDREGNQVDRGYTTHMSDIANRLLANRLKQMEFEGKEKARGIKSDGTVRGALFAPGYTQDQVANYLTTLSGMDRERMGAEREQAGYARDLSKLDLSDRGIGLKEQGIGLKEQGIGLSEREVGIANQKLDTMSQSLGIDRAQLQNQLNQGLAQLGLDRQFSINEIIARAGAAGSQYQGFYTQLLSDIIAMSVDPAALMASFEYQQNPGTGVLSMP